MIQPVAEPPKTPEYPIRPTSNFIPFDEMTDAQAREHLMVAHGFEEYEAPDDVQYYLRTTDRKSLDCVHDEDHTEETPYGGSYKCPHVHGKVIV